MRDKLSQRQRVFALAIDVGVLIFISHLAFGSVLPPVGDKGFWFYAALLSVLIGTKLVTPFFVKPVDAIAYAVPALVALLLVNDWSNWQINVRTAYAVALFIAGASTLLALLAITLNGWGRPSFQEVSNRLRLLIDGLASPVAIYAPALLFAMFAFHYQSPSELVGVSAAMVLVTALSFGELTVSAYSRVSNALLNQSGSPFGSVAAIQKPNIYLLRSEYDIEAQLPSPTLIKDELVGPRLGFAIDVVGREEGHLCRAIDLGATEESALKVLNNSLPPGGCMLLTEADVANLGDDSRQLLENAAGYIGLSAPDSTVGRLYFEVTRNEGLSIGRLVSVAFDGLTVYYQLVSGQALEEIVHRKNTFGYLRGQAQQIGVWDGHRFFQHRWLPDINSPAELVSEEVYEPRADTVGHFPQTNFTASLSSTSDLVTHNTAILGILGVGKSMLSIELVERMMADGIKVICLDLTNQYAEELSEFFCEESHANGLRRIWEACANDRDETATNPEEGGSLPHLRSAIREDLQEFLCEDNPELLKIYNPADFSATRQESEPRSFRQDGAWQRAAGLYSVTPVEVTQLVSEAALECLSDRMTDKARACLVYEEAHSLVPEWNSVVAEGDKRATSGTARAILQGRKYGLGCLLITQRTANVTKTILNQCNSVFAMRTFDETGKSFLSNYVGEEYANELSSIPERHAVFFGKASECENPVLIRLNDRQDFLRAFRRNGWPPSKEDLCRSDLREGVDHPEPVEELEDDIPF